MKVICVNDNCTEALRTQPKKILKIGKIYDALPLNYFYAGSMNCIMIDKRIYYSDGFVIITPQKCRKMKLEKLYEKW